MRTSLLALVLLLASSAFAMNRVQELSQQNPGKSAHQILKQAYDEATTPASFSDFNWYNRKSDNLHCVLADNTARQTPDLMMYIVRYPYVIDPAVPGTPAGPGYGPLFPPSPAVPGIPARYGTCLTELFGTLDHFEQDVQDVCEHNTYQLSARDLIIINSYDVTDVPTKMFLRKDRGLVLIKEQDSTYIIDGMPHVTYQYGYCYKN